MSRLRLPARGWWARALIDAAIVAAIAVSSYQLAFRYLAQLDYPTLIDWELRPAVMASCGLGFVEPGGHSPARDAFVQRKSGAIACADFAWGGAPVPAPDIAAANRYSIYGAAWAMRWRGVSWETLDAYLASLFALSMSAVYGLYRMAAGRVLAVAGVLAIALSTTLSEITTLRDFVKLPCFAVLWLVLGWLVHRAVTQGAQGTLAPMVAGGALVGVGIGFRMDALVFLPVLPAVAFLIAPGFTWRDVGKKSLTIAAFAAAFIVTASPILRSLSGGSNSSHVVILGLMKQFDPGLGIDSAPYDIGATYSDGFGYTVTVSHGLRSQGRRLPMLMGSAEYDRTGTGLILAMVRNFPADFMARAIGATLQIARYPFDRRIREQSATLATFQSSAVLRALVAARTRVLGLFAGRELAAILLVLVLAAACDWRLGALGAVLIAYFCGYSMLQFSRRHVFHLDVITMFVAVLAVQLPLTLAWRRFRRRTSPRFVRQWAIGIAVLIATVLTASAALAGARRWQQAHVAALVDTTLAARWIAIEPRDQPLADSILTDDRPTATWQEIYDADPERWRTATLMRLDGVVPPGEEAGAAPDLRQQYFMVTLEGRCDSADVTLVPAYASETHTFHHEYNRAFTLPVATSEATRLLVPAYYHLGPNWNRLDGFAVAAAERPCVSGIFSAAEPASLPMPIMTFALAPDWRERTLYQRVLARPAITMVGTVVDPPPSSRAERVSGWRRDADAPLALAAPPLDAWERSPGVSFERHPNLIRVTGNSVESADQLVSPALEVPANRSVAIQVVGLVATGEMCVGVADAGRRQWLLPPTSRREPLLAETGAFTAIRIVFSNCARRPSEIAVKSISYEAVEADHR